MKKLQRTNSPLNLLPCQALLRSGDSTPEQQAQVDDLPAKYKDIFVRNDDELGYTETVKHKIFTTDDITAFPEAKEQIQKLLEQGIIFGSRRPYSSPIVLVQKNGSLRTCVLITAE